MMFKIYACLFAALVALAPQQCRAQSVLQKSQKYAAVTLGGASLIALKKAVDYYQATDPKNPLYKEILNTYYLALTNPKKLWQEDRFSALVAAGTGVALAACAASDVNSYRHFGVMRNQLQLLAQQDGLPQAEAATQAVAMTDVVLRLASLRGDSYPEGAAGKDSRRPSSAVRCDVLQQLHDRLAQPDVEQTNRVLALRAFAVAPRQLWCDNVHGTDPRITQFLAALKSLDAFDYRGNVPPISPLYRPLLGLFPLDAFTQLIVNSDCPPALALGSEYEQIWLRINDRVVSIVATRRPDQAAVDAREIRAAGDAYLAQADVASSPAGRSVADASLASTRSTDEWLVATGIISRDQAGETIEAARPASLEKIQFKIIAAALGFTGADIGLSANELVEAFMMGPELNLRDSMRAFLQTHSTQPGKLLLALDRIGAGLSPELRVAALKVLSNPPPHYAPRLLAPPEEPSATVHPNTVIANLLMGGAQLASENDRFLQFKLEVDQSGIVVLKSASGRVIGSFPARQATA